MSSRPATAPANSRRRKRKQDTSQEEGVNIKVAVRCRPLNASELAGRGRTVTSVDEISKTIDLELGGPRKSSKTYSFDHCFGTESTQTDVYDTVVEPMVTDVLEGFNATIFAYGQTGTGKTFTMTGEVNEETGEFRNSTNAGIIPRCIENIFDRLNALRVDYTVRVSYLELYNEELIDLLGIDDQNLRIYEDTKSARGVFVNNLEETPVHTSEDIYEILRRGTERRVTAATEMNHQSSRSHTIFSITLHMKESTPEGEDLLKIGKLHLVDLAGSENIGRSGAMKKRAREAGNINQSLLTLGRVINALVENAPHIPYRESKLTRLLQDSLGGRTKTCIIAAISPASVNTEETASTLDYARRAKNIRNTPEVNQRMTTKAAIKEYAEEIETLKDMLKTARSKDGVFLSESRYETMNETIASQAENIETLEANIAERDKLLEQLKELQAATAAELDQRTQQLHSTEATLTETKETLSATEANLKATEEVLEETEAVVEEHVTAEDCLYGEATTLVSTVTTAVADIDGLFGKIERKAAVESTNKETAAKFESSLSSRLSAIETNVADYADDQSASFSALRTRAKNNASAATAELEGIATGLAGLSQLVSAAVESIASSTQQTASAAAESSAEFASKAAETNESVAAQLTAMEELVSQTVASVTAALQSQVDRVTAMATDIEQWTAASETELKEFTTTHTSALSDIDTANKEAMATVASAAAEHSDNINAFVTEHESQVAAVEARLSAKFAELLASELGSLASSVNSSGSGFASSAEALGEAATEASTAVSTSIAAAVEGVAVHETAAIESAKALVVTVAEAVSDIEETTADGTATATAFGEDYSGKSAAAASTSAEAASTAGSDATALAEAVAQGCESTATIGSDLGTNYSEATEETSAAIAEGIESTAGRGTEWASVIDDVECAATEFVSQLSEDLEETRTEAGGISTALVEDVPTGSTPAKKKFSYPVDLTRARPHEVVIEEVRSRRPSPLAAADSETGETSIGDTSGDISVCSEGSVSSASSEADKENAGSGGSGAVAASGKVVATATTETVRGPALSHVQQ